MNAKTAQKLIKLNYAFYQTIGKYFDSSRNYFWPGWRRLKPQLKIINEQLAFNEKLNVLDLGCGNARFAEFLIKECEIKNLDYTGIDYSELLIEKAQERMSKLQISNFKLDNVDLLFGNWDLRFQVYDLIVMFGVMHHVPSKDLRIRLLRKIYSIMDMESIFVVTFWKFKDIPRLERRIVKTGSDELKNALEGFGLVPEELEVGDYILDWERGLKSYRYCHYYSTEEAISILQEAGFKVNLTYKADAKEDVVNEYIICTKN